MLYFNIGRHGCSKPREDCVKLSVDAGFSIELESGIDAII
jgi:hypothetical protein